MTQLRTNPGVAAVADPVTDRVTCMVLPCGDIQVLIGPAARLWGFIGDGYSSESAIEAVLATYADPPSEAHALLSAALDDLCRTGLILRLDPPNDDKQ